MYTTKWGLTTMFRKYLCSPSIDPFSICHVPLLSLAQSALPWRRDKQMRQGTGKSCQLSLSLSAKWDKATASGEIVYYFKQRERERPASQPRPNRGHSSFCRCKLWEIGGLARPARCWSFVQSRQVLLRTSLAQILTLMTPLAFCLSYIVTH